MSDFTRHPVEFLIQGIEYVGPVVDRNDRLDQVPDDGSGVKVEHFADA
jgi:hypothetical protein